MKEIKFRAWYTKDQRMMSWKEILEDKNNDGEDVGTFLQGIMSDVSPVMQFTGLKDKNGVEIYEGDIIVVREVHDNDEDIWDSQKQLAIPQEIKWDNKRCKFEFGNATRIFYQPEHFEVIGNVYQNSELLEVK